MGSLREIGEIFDKQSKEIDERIATAQAKEKRLAAFKANLEAEPGVFDSDDLEAVQDEILAMRQRVEGLFRERAEMADRQKKLRGLLEEASETLSRRTKIIEKADGELQVLQDNPELCRRFARKHVGLQNMIRDGIEKLSKSLSSCLVLDDADGSTATA